MIDEKDIEAEAPAESGKTLDTWLHGLTPEQFAAVKATVNSVADTREAPNLGAMSDAEFRKYTEKNFGFSPI